MRLLVSYSYEGGNSSTRAEVQSSSSVRLGPTEILKSVIFRTKRIFLEIFFFFLLDPPKIFSTPLKGTAATSTNHACAYRKKLYIKIGNADAYFMWYDALICQRISNCCNYCCNI